MKTLETSAMQNRYCNITKPGFKNQNFDFRYFVICCIVPLIFSGKTSAQTTYSKKTFTIDNGISYNFVLNISQDTTGFLWLSTWDGLSRYDGHEFRNYYHKPNDPTTFPFFLVEKTFVDNQNTVWVICPKRQLVTYNRAKDNFEPFLPDGFNSFIACDIVQGEGNNLWIFNDIENKLYGYNTDTKAMQIFMPNKNTDDLDFSLYLPKLIYDNNGDIWIFCHAQGKSELFKIYFKGDSIIELQKYEPFPTHYFEPISEYRKPAVFDIFISETGKTWMFSNFGLFVLEPGSSKFVENSAKIEITDFAGKKFFYWSDNKSGINIIDTKEKAVFNIKPEPGKFVGSIFIDSQNTVWSGNYAETYEGIGLNRYTKNPDIFKHYLTEENEFGNPNLIFPILQDSNRDIWVATRGLDYLFKIKPDGEVQKIKYMTQTKSENHPKVRSMVEDSTGIWMGCTDDVLLKYEHATDKFSSFDFAGKNLNMRIHNILLANGNLKINGSDDLFSYDIDQGVLSTKYKSGEAPKFCMVSDGKKGFWTGSINSTIFHFDEQFKEIGRYQIGNGNTNVEHVCIGDSNDVWIALMGGGLGHLYPESGEVEIFTSANGLSNNTTYSILKDRKGNLWISTNKGISRFNPKTKHFRNFGKAEGLMIEEFNSDAFFHAQDDEMFFGGVGGLVSFYADSVEQNLITCSSGRLLVTEITVSGEHRYFDKPVYELDTITLEKGDNNFQLTFAVINFQHPEKIKYRYRLLGANSRWIETDFRKRSINFSNLKPGRLRLEIEASNIYGKWDSAIAMVVQIPRFYYQTLWFKLLLILFAVFIVAGNLFMFFRHIRLKAKQKNDVLKLESLRGQMNPHFIFNSLNSINYFISNNDKISANHYIADFSRLIRSFLTNLSKDYIPFDKELETLEDYLKLEHLRFGNKFDYVLLADKIQNKEETFVFPGMVQPFIENAVWHGVRGLKNRKGFIKIEFLPVSPKKIRCIIQDDGIGREQSKISKNYLPGKQSRGIGIVTERLRIISRIKKVDYAVKISDVHPDEEYTGTLVMIDLPLK